MEQVAAAEAWPKGGRARIRQLCNALQFSAPSRLPLKADAWHSDG